MIIGIDARFAIKSRRGIGNYSLNLLRYLQKLDKKNNYILYINELDLNNVLPNGENFKVQIIKPSNFILWEQVMLPYYVKRDNLNILHCLGNTAPLWLPRNLKLIVTLHDIMFLKDNIKVAGIYNLLGKVYRSFIVKKIINKVTRLITVSKFSKQDIITNLNLSGNKINVIWESYNEEYKILLTEMPLQVGKYILCLGANDPRKNTLMVIDVFADLVANGFDGKLIIIGFKNWENSPVYKLSIKLDIGEKVIFKDYIENDELVNYYRFATLFLYTSLYEGFGIPPLEAMACGCPVIASNITSIPEIVEDAALLVSPYSKKEIYNACIKIINDNFLRQILIEKGLKRVKVFSWEKMSIQTLNIYHELNITIN